MVEHLLPKQGVAGSSPVSRSRLGVSGLGVRREGQNQAVIAGVPFRQYPAAHYRIFPYPKLAQISTTSPSLNPVASVGYPNGLQTIRVEPNT